jgi:hypothetical protein
MSSGAGDPLRLAGPEVGAGVEDEAVDAQERRATELVGERAA